MKWARSVLPSLACAGATLCASRTLLAQPGAPEPAVDAGAPAPLTVPAPTEPVSPQPAPAPAVPPDVKPANGGVAQAASQPPPSPKWYDALELGAFVDAYYAHNWRRPRPNKNANLYHPYTANTGFSLAWIGLDAAVQPDPVGAVLQLRFGPAVPNLALGDFAIPGGIGFVQNGYVSWKPGGKDGKLNLILGKFDTVYGAEVAKSQDNINYSRGLLYNLAQPFFHTGLRADIQLTDSLQLKLLAVNGWNNTIDNNRGKSFGAQLVASPAEGVTFAAGYLGGPEESDVNEVTCGATEAFDPASSKCIAAPAGATTGGGGVARNVGADSRWRHLVDVVGDATFGKLRAVVNGDYVTQTISVDGQDTPVAWFGASALLRYPLTDVWAVGARGEIIRDKDGQISAPNAGPITIYTGTLTIEAAPHKMLLIRLDNRIDAADSAVFPTGLRGNDKTQLTSILGVVAKTN